MVRHCYKTDLNVGQDICFEKCEIAGRICKKNEFVGGRIAKLRLNVKPLGEMN